MLITCDKPGRISFSATLGRLADPPPTHPFRHNSYEGRGNTSLTIATADEPKTGVHFEAVPK